MATPPRDPKETAMRSRIISHMNGDHHESLVHYLQHHYSLTEEEASDAELIDINLKQIVLKANKQCYTLPIIPPMISFSEARERLVAMDRESKEALGLPVETEHAKVDGTDINGSAKGYASKGGHISNVNRYVPPTGFHLVVFVAALTTYVVFARPEHVRPGSVVYDYALRYAPSFATFCQRIQFWLFSGMVGIHGFETALMSEKLRKNGVPVGSPLWFSWTASCFVEGFGSFSRLNQLVKRNKGERGPSK